MRRLVFLSFLLVLALPLHAQELFSLVASGGGTTVRGAGSNVINLITNLSDNANQFAPLANQNYTAALNYAGIQNAVRVSQSFDNNGNRILNLQVPSTGLNRTFSSANGALNDQIRHFLEHDGLAALSDFQAVVSRTSLAGVVDGNPLAATAMLQDAGFEAFALHRAPLGIGDADASDYGKFTSRYWADGGDLDAGGISGAFVSLTIASELRFNEHVAIDLLSPFRWITMRGANVFMGGTVLGLPITFIPAHDGGFSWTVTPAGHSAVVGSADFASGGIIYGGQVANQLSYTIGDLTFTLADNAGYYHGADITIGSYEFNTKLNQWLFRNGLQVSKSWGNFFIDASASWTNFLRDAFSDGYLTPEAGLGWRFGKNNASGFRVSYVGNFGDHYHTNGGSVLLYFSR